MKNKIIFSIVLMILLILFNYSISNNVLARDYIFQTQSSIKISSDEDDPISIDPFGLTRTIQLKISYTYNRLARPDGFPFPNRKLPTNINITIDEKPDWCLASIDRGSFEIPIKTFIFKKNETINLSTNITLQIINSKIDANTENNLGITVETNENGNIQSTSLMHSIKITPDPFLSIDSYLTPNSIINMFGGEERNITIKLKNNGNIQTKTKIESNNNFQFIELLIDGEKNFNEYITNIDKEKNISLNIRSFENITENQSILIIFNLTSFPSNDNLDDTFFDELQLEIKLNKNIIDDESEDLNLVNLIGIIALFLIILPIIIVYFYYRKNK